MERFHGPHGPGAVNDAGKELLSFLAVNKATVCNTWFEKNIHIYKQTGSTPDTSSGTISIMLLYGKGILRDALMYV